MHGRLFEFDLRLFGADYSMPFPSYFVLLITGFLFATLMGAVWAKRIGHNPDVIVDLGLAMLLAGVAGGRIMHVLVDGYFWDYVHLCTDPSLVTYKVSKAQCLGEYAGYWDMVKEVCRPKERDCWAWARFYAGGLAYYGGFGAASVTAYFLLKADRFPFWRGADMAGMVVPMGLGFGRLGCLLAGCCFGKPSDLGWALSFPGGSPASEAQHRAGLLESTGMASHPVHPTQIYESGASLAIAAFLILYLHGRKRYDGQVFVSFVALYAAMRFALEFLRDDDRGALFGVSSSQWLGLLLLGLAFFAHRRLSQGPGASTTSPPTAESAA